MLTFLSKAFLLHDIFVKRLDIAIIIYYNYYYSISSEELELIMHSRKTVLFWEDCTWVEIEGDEDFDIPMGML